MEEKLKLAHSALEVGTTPSDFDWACSNRSRLKWRAFFYELCFRGRIRRFRNSTNWPFNVLALMFFKVIPKRIAQNNFPKSHFSVTLRIIWHRILPAIRITRRTLRTESHSHFRRTVVRPRYETQVLSARRPAQELLLHGGPSWPIVNSCSETHE
jgi:hypothetical protein